MKQALKLIVVSSLVFSVTGFAAPLRTEQDKLSYTIGNELGTSFRQHGESLTPAIVMQGLQDGLSGRKSQLTTEQKQAVMLAYQKKMIAKSENKMADQSKTNQEQGEKFLAENAKKPGVQVTQDGLQYKIIDAGSGAQPSATDTVKVDYEGTLINGTVFDSSYQRGTPAEFPVNQVIPGWTEALQMMKTGATWMLYIPAKLAYGAQGMPMASIGPNSVLVFKVHLISIK